MLQSHLEYLLLVERLALRLLRQITNREYQFHIDGHSSALQMQTFLAYFLKFHSIDRKIDPR